MTTYCRKHTEAEKSVKSFFFGLLMFILIILGTIALLVITIVAIYMYLKKKDPPKAEEMKIELKKKATDSHERIKKVEWK